MKKVIIIVVLLGIAGVVAVKVFGVKPPEIKAPKITKALTGKGEEYTSKSKKFGIWVVKKQIPGKTLTIKVVPEGKSMAIGLDFLSVCKDIVDSRSTVPGWDTMQIVPYIKVGTEHKRAGLYSISKENWDMYVEKGKRGDLKQYAATAEWTYKN